MTQLGKGRAAAVTDADMAALADDFGCHPADLEAIAEVESSGFGWFRDGRIKILFEKHWFYKLTSGANRDEAVRKGLARRHWVSPSKGGYSDQKGADSRYRLLEVAIRIDREAALQSVSIGKFQIMGFNHKVCGFASASEMWASFLDSEVNQLRAFGNFLRSNGLVGALRRRDFAKIENGYNGGGLGGAYARRMKAASDKLRAGKWNGYTPGSMPVDPPAPSPKPVAESIAEPTETPPVPGSRPNWTPDEDVIDQEPQAAPASDAAAGGGAVVVAGGAAAAAQGGHPVLAGLIFAVIVLAGAAFLLHRKGKLKPLLSRIKGIFS